MDSSNQPGETCAVAIGKIDVQKHRIDGVVLQFRKRSFNIVRRGLKCPAPRVSYRGHLATTGSSFTIRICMASFPTTTFQQCWSDLSGVFMVAFLNAKFAVQGGESVIKQTVIYSAKPLNSRMY